MNTNISLPKSLKLIEQISKNRAVFEIKELYPGYGLTLGNALRRIMLSSLPGAAVTSIKISNADHEFSVLPGILEDIVEIILNLKQIRFKMYGDESQVITIKAKGEKKVLAKDIKLTSQIEVANPDTLVANLTSKNASLEIEMIVEKGVGYSELENRKKDKQEIGSIAIDAIFTPVKMINYEIENMRVGDKTDYNRLKFDIETDGTITPEKALTDAAKILIEQLKVVANPINKIEEIEEKKEPEKKLIEKERIEEDATKIRIEDLKLSVRTQNILLNNHIKTVAGLLRMKENDLLQFEGMGNKAVKELKKAMGKLGLTLKQEE